MGRNDGYEYRERLGSGAEGTALVDYLAARYPHSTHAEWTERIDAGRLRIDGRVADANAVLQAGQRLTWRRPPWQEPEAPLTFGVLHRDAHLLAVAKPAGLPTLPGGGFLEHTLLGLVRRLDRSASPLHRLGRWTSGLVVFATTRVAGAALTSAWRSGEVLKRYRALATGTAPRGELTVQTPIGPVPYPPLGTLHAASPRGKTARSRIEPLEQRDGAFLADVFIATGRPHQIRIHLAAAGHPLLGDPLYAPGGLPSSGCSALPGDPGYRLHAAELRFRHPVSGEELRLDCHPPPWGRTGR